MPGEELTISADVLTQAMDGVPLCWHCRSVHVIHIDHDENGKLRWRITVAHEPMCRTMFGPK